MRTGAGDYFRSRQVRERRVRWFVFANRTEAVFYRDLPEGRFQFVDRLKNPKGNRIEGDFDSDRPGTGVSSAGDGSIRHALDRTFHHLERNREAFARAIAGKLEERLRGGAFTELVLVAEPRFLGLLRAALPESLRERIIHEVHREYLEGSDEQLREATVRAMDEGR
jgi:protein required for attachment to host cells